MVGEDSRPPRHSLGHAAHPHQRAENRSHDKLAADRRHLVLARPLLGILGRTGDLGDLVA